MNALTLAELQGRTEKIRERIRQRYHLAKSLGFSTYEATILSKCNEDTIRRLAAEKVTQ